jgi:hypothetical protein
MALNFPNSPTLNQIYTDNTSGFSYQWNGTVWISFTPSSSSQIKTLDDFSASFNNSTQTFSLTSGGSAVTPPTSQSLIINLGGVIQDPTDDYSISGSNITFSTAPANGLSFSGVALGPAVPVNTIPDGTVTDGSLRISTTAVVGSATTFTEDLVVSGDARVTGILTVGTSSITLDGITNVINVGTGLTLSSSGIVAGVITATSFSGDGSGLTGVGVGTEDSINTTGIITASAVSANEFIGTGDKLIFSPTITFFSPADGSTGVTLDTNIVLTFDQPIYAGVGSIFLRNSSGIGTIIEAIGIGSTSQITINNQTLTINPSGFLPSITDVYVVLPQGVIKNAVGGGIASLSSYNFTTVDFVLSSINPANGATNVGITTNVTLTFTSPPTRGTGTVQLRSGSTSGSLIESFNAASSDRISVAGNNWILDPTSDLGFTTSIHTIIPSTAINSYVGLNTTGADTHSFTTKALGLGDPYEGGFLICQSGGTNWVVSPYSAEVSRSWHSRDDASTRAQQVSGCSGWFVPTCGQLQNPGSACRTFWDSFSPTTYWSSTEGPPPSCAWRVDLPSGSADVGYSGGPDKTATFCVRSFRCVSY